ncbi:MAG TPA: hypothetical protein VF794_00975 [Archangium sp.]|uniref:hypothetical protein n=1 Tax=Archangium sp. TaxID=1872627 RepID=UPI002ED85E86
MVPLKTWVLVAVLLGAFTGLALPHGSGAKESPALQKQGPSVVVHGAHVVHLSQDGKVHAWRTKDLGADPEYARVLASQPLRLLATGRGQLWGTDLARVYRWSEESRTWKPEFQLPASTEPAIALAVVGGTVRWSCTRHAWWRPGRARSIRLPR